ncbi:hypothetical protein M422DRAFT_45674 [Sphaerobolus stellatus SS14]|nr:hypothetical protein M422DRAFT_45674 [Sphaerobolus stellatus SS14]
MYGARPRNSATIVFSTEDLLLQILGKNGFPPPSSILARPDSIPRSMNLMGQRITTECFIHSNKLIQYQAWVSLCSTLCCVSKLFHALISPHLLNQLWMDYPWRFKQFLTGYSTADPNHRHSQFRLVKYLRVTWAMIVWGGWADMEDESPGAPEFG